MNCIDKSESNYDRVVDYYRSNYDQVEFSYKRAKFVYSGGNVDHHMLLVSYVVGKGWFGGSKWAYALYDNDNSYSVDSYDEVDALIERIYSSYNPLGGIEIYTENFYKGANFWECITDDLEW